MEKLWQIWWKNSSKKRAMRFIRSLLQAVKVCKSSFTQWHALFSANARKLQRKSALALSCALLQSMIQVLLFRRMVMDHLACADRKLFAGFARQTLRMQRQSATLQIALHSSVLKRNCLKRAQLLALKFVSVLAIMKWSSSGSQQLRQGQNNSLASYIVVVKIHVLKVHGIRWRQNAIASLMMK